MRAIHVLDYAVKLLFVAIDRAITCCVAERLKGTLIVNSNAANDVTDR